ncbi:hypothetical protein DVH24_030145 [Malus domestica]|uniref:Uncharacterized protein n=1 Tax=Malus domestica TaxID=3750 RepID=A0A498HZ66_MALDO|nr:hypothetical protein DVH24_030145 [Malus domestica]
MPHNSSVFHFSFISLPFSFSCADPNPSSLSFIVSNLLLSNTPLLLREDRKKGLSQRRDSQELPILETRVLLQHKKMNSEIWSSKLETERNEKIEGRKCFFL